MEDKYDQIFDEIHADIEKKQNEAIKRADIILSIIAFIFLAILTIKYEWTFIISIFFYLFAIFREYGVIIIIVAVVLWILHKFFKFFE